MTWCCDFSIVSASRLQIRLGGIFAADPEPGVFYSGVSRIIMYPYYMYSNETETGDIALLKLSSPVTFTDTVRPVCLPWHDVDLNRFKVCVTTGFGQLFKAGR